ncbi:MAG TPA: AAA family ATPase, partial [Paludibacter sp.]|nr:AAA family ATPase [Paludibacter sp.]
NHSLLDFAEQFSRFGGTHILIDEIHRYPNWAIELKNIYDSYPELHIVFSGSSMLEIYNANADLSRRAVIFELHGLSFREYLLFEGIADIPVVSLEEIIENHINIATSIVSKHKIALYFRNYISSGFYPIYKEGLRNYTMKLQNVVNTIIDKDIPAIEKIDFSGMYALKKMLMTLSTLVPYTPNIEKLSTDMQLNRATTLKYLSYLSKAGLINSLMPANKGMSILTKPEKVLLNNTNLLFALSTVKPEEGNVRETFMVNQLKVKYKVATSQKGDFLIENKYIVEVGGKNKKYNQIKDIPDSYIVSDAIDIGWGNKIPIWLFGLLY